MSEEQDKWTATGEFVPNWSPRKSGNKEDGYTDRVAGDDSWIVGYYLGSREQKSQKNDDVYVVHKIKATSCGNADHLGVALEEGGTIYEFFGTSVLNNNLAEEITPGQHIRIKWFGLTQPKTENGRPYQNWKTWIDNETEPINVQNGVIINTPTSSEKEAVVEADKAVEQKPAQNTADTVADGDDDLPF